jgi:ABC-type sulfate transport system permease subunit
MLTDILLLAQNDGGGGGGGIIGGLIGSLCNCIFLIIFVVVPLIGLWKIFEKAGKPGWAALIPIYNAVVLLEIIDRPIWWLILLFCVGPVFGVIVALELAKSFGKGIGFAVGMILVPFIFYPMLGFGDAKYQGPQHVF